MTRRSPLPASAWSPRSARRRGVVGAHGRGQCGIRPLPLFDTAGFRSRIAAEVDLDESTASFTAGSGAAGRAAIRSASPPRGRRSPIQGCSSRTAASRIGVLLGAGTADLLRNEDYYFTMVTDGHRARAPVDVYHHFSSTPVDVIAAPLRVRGAARRASWPPVRRARSRSASAADAIRRGGLDAVLAGGTDALARLTFSGFNALRLMDAEPCRPFDRARAGMSIGEGAAILVLEDTRTRAPARRADLRRVGRLQSRLRGLPSDGAGTRRVAVAAMIIGPRSTRPADRRRGRSRQRARHGHAAERPR